MTAEQDLYEPATPREPRSKPDALLHVGDGYTFYVGTLDSVGLHHHAAPVFLAGLYGRFALRISHGEWHTCRTAVIPAGVEHELAVSGAPLTAYYPEGNVAGVKTLGRLTANGSERDGVLLGHSGAILPFRELYENSASQHWTAEALNDIVGFAQKKHTAGTMDKRIASAMERLQNFPDDLTAIETVARRNGLSSSRFLHLFSEHAGVPYRRYRMWSRLRAAMRSAVAGETLTDAAMMAGFFDSPHFTHNFRDTFGVTPSYVFSKVARAGRGDVMAYTGFSGSRHDE